MFWVDMAHCQLLIWFSCFLPPGGFVVIVLVLSGLLDLHHLPKLIKQEFQVHF